MNWAARDYLIILRPFCDRMTDHNITGSFCTERAVYNSNGRKTLSASLSTGPLLKLISSLVLKETIFPTNVLFR